MCDRWRTYRLLVVLRLFNGLSLILTHSLSFPLTPFFLLYFLPLCGLSFPSFALSVRIENVAVKSIRINSRRHTFLSRRKSKRLKICTHTHSETFVYVRNLCIWGRLQIFQITCYLHRDTINITERGASSTPSSILVCIHERIYINEYIIPYICISESIYTIHLHVLYIHVEYIYIFPVSLLMLYV